MKLTITIEIIIMCIILTVFSVFTMDSASIKKAELASILTVEAPKIVEDFFEGKCNAANLQSNLETIILTTSNTKTSNISVTVYYADATYGVVDILAELIYTQPNGRPRAISYRRTYIKEAQADEMSETPYSFIRTIDKTHYKTSTNDFVWESNGGLKEDSIWRTAKYEEVLDAVFATSH